MSCAARSLVSVLLFWFIQPGAVDAQISRGGKPMQIDRPATGDIPLYRVWRHPENRQERRRIKSSGGIGGYPFADLYAVALDMENAGCWITTDAGWRVWLLRIRSDNARSIGIIFDKFRIPCGARLFLYDPLKRHILGAFTERNNKPSGILAVSHIPGDEVILQYELPLGLPDAGELSVGQAAHATVDIFSRKATHPDAFGTSDTCEIDINCEEGQGWQTVKRSVCSYIYPDHGTQRFCSGTLINNTALDGSPYLYTASHCIARESQANAAVFYFNYESPSCDGPDGDTTQSISGASILATADSLDFSLLELSVAPPGEYKPYYAGWNRGAAPPDHTVCIHHPRGDVKKISLDNDPPDVSYHTDNYYPEYVLYSHWRILRWDRGTTEGGSSGAPLFDPMQRVVGDLTGGEAFCGNSMDDYFTRIDHCWDYFEGQTKQLKYWLDPLGTDAISLDGMDPYPGNVPEKFPDNHAISVYPNPSTGMVMIDPGSICPGRIEVQVFSLNGILLIHDEVNSNGKFKLDMQQPGPGAYILVIRCHELSFRHKLLIVN